MKPQRVTKPRLRGGVIEYIEGIDILNVSDPRLDDEAGPAHVGLNRSRRLQTPKCNGCGAASIQASIGTVRLIR